MRAREAILRYLKRTPGATVREMAAALGMTQANIRHHLSLLEAEGHVEARPLPRTRKRGRPPKGYFLTAKGLPSHLEPLTRALLRFLREQGISPAALCPWFCGRGPLPGSLHQRLTDVLAFFRERHYQPKWEAHRDGPRILFGQCPYGALSRDFPELCQLDREALAYLLEAEVEPIQYGFQEPLCIFAIRPNGKGKQGGTG